MRNYFLDNAKVILIFLVVFGHAVITGSDLANDTKWLIYTFHMPMFILIAGFFEKKKSIEKLVKDIFWSCIVPYIVFRVAQNIIREVFMDRSLLHEIEEPMYTLWFLMALAIFKVAMQIYLRIPKIALVAFVIHLFTFDLWIENYSDNAVGRTTAFFLFYLLGYYMRKVFEKEKIKEFFDRNWRFYIGTVIIIIVFVLKSTDINMPNMHWLTAILDGDKKIANMEQWELIMKRMGTIFLQITMVIAVFMVIPKKEYNWTKYGAWTLSIYLFHGVIIKYLEAYNFFKKNDNPETLYITLGLTIIIIYITTRKPCLDFIDWITNKKK